MLLLALLLLLLLPVHLCNTHTAAGSKSSGSLMAKLSLRFGRSHQLATLDMMLLLVWHTPLNPK
jgi:hypothetical protein